LNLLLFVATSGAGMVLADLAAMEHCARLLLTSADTACEALLRGPETEGGV